MFFQYVNSPIGTIRVDASADAVTRVAFIDGKSAKPDAANAITTAAVSELSAYFAGTLDAFSVPLAPSGTAFQQQVWQQLQRIPCGSTISYAQLADWVGKPKGAQAVGQANGRNPIAVIIPCHRVIGKDGSLTGYAGGLERKAWLLQHEATLSGKGH